MADDDRVESVEKTWKCEGSVGGSARLTQPETSHVFARPSPATPVDFRELHISEHVVGSWARFMKVALWLSVLEGQCS